MLVLRRIDYFVEWTIIILMIISLPFTYQFGFLTGLFFLGVIQLINGIFNTRSFLYNGFKKEITRYWWFVIADLLFLFPLIILDDRSLATILFYMLVTIATGISFYYLIIYKKLMNAVQFKDELSGFTK